LTNASEVLRLARDKTQVISELSVWQKPGTQRIYIPLFEFNDIFEEEMARLPQHQSKELPEPFLLSGSGNVKVLVSSAQYKRVKQGVVRGIKAYLKKWEEGGQERIFLVTRYALHCEDYFGDFEFYVYKGDCRGF
jgi:hypothetical protein